MRAGRHTRRREGRAWITGLASEMLDPTDPYPTGYVLADTWGVSGTTSQSSTFSPQEQGEHPAGAFLRGRRPTRHRVGRIL